MLVAVQDRVKGAKDKAGQLRSRGKNLMSKIKNEDDENERRIDGDDEHNNLVEKRRQLFQKLEGGGGDLTADADQGNSADDTKAANEWELNFVKRARRKRTTISVCLGLLLTSLVFVPPIVVYLMDNACQDPSMSEDVPFIFDIVGALHSIQVETFRGTVRIESDTNASHVDTISVEITKKATSEDGMAGISASASMDLLLKKLTVTATFDELSGGEFGLGNCPQADITIRVPRLSQSSAANAPSLNVTVDGETGDPVFYPWVPNLVGFIGEIDLAFNPDRGMVFGATILRNTVGSITVKRLKATHLSAVTSNGSITVDSTTVNTCRVVTHSGDITITGTELSRTDDIVAEENGLVLLGAAGLLGSDLIQRHALGYGVGVRGKLHASSSSGNVVIDRVSGGDIEARTGLGDIDLVLPVPGFSGPYDLRAPFGWKSLTVQRLADRLGEPCPYVCSADLQHNSQFTLIHRRTATSVHSCSLLPGFLST